MTPHSVVDLYCGIGGMTHGFVREGLSVVTGIDNDPTCKYAYEKNNGATFLERDVEIMAPDEISELFNDQGTKVLIGCAPCQPFSKYSKKKTPDEKWRLVQTFADLVKIVKPHIVSMENVPQLTDHDVFQKFLETLEEEGYHTYWNLVNCADYGVPQKRIRLVLLASALGKIKLIKKTHSQSKWRTVRQTIKRLEPIKAGEISKNDSLHRASALSEMNLKRIVHTPPGGGWKDWPEELLLECHKKESGKTYRDVYGRMLWDEPAPTMTTQCHGLGNGRFGHPEQNRAISLREAALLQTFPPDYDFVEPGSEIYIGRVAKHIGNAVPVRLGQIIARSIKKHLEVQNGRNDTSIRR